MLDEEEVGGGGGGEGWGKGGGGGGGEEGGGAQVEQAVSLNIFRGETEYFAQFEYQIVN